jgi:hypothetical protein
MVLQYDNVLVLWYDMIEYWYCVNIPPRPLVDLRESRFEKEVGNDFGRIRDEKKKRRNRKKRVCTPQREGGKTWDGIE